MSWHDPQLIYIVEKLGVIWILIRLNLKQLYVHTNMCTTRLYTGIGDGELSIDTLDIVDWMIAQRQSVIHTGLRGLSQTWQSRSGHCAMNVVCRTFQVCTEFVSTLRNRNRIHCDQWFTYCIVFAFFFLKKWSLHITYRLYVISHKTGWQNFLRVIFVPALVIVSAAFHLTLPV